LRMSVWALGKVWCMVRIVTVWMRIGQLSKIDVGVVETRVCVRVRVCVWVRVCLRAGVCFRVGVCVRARVCLRARVCVGNGRSFRTGNCFSPAPDLVC